MCFRPADAQAASKTCPECGADNGYFDTECSKCGAKLESRGPAPSAGAPGAPKMPGAPGAPGAPKPPGAPAAPGAPKPPGANS